VSSRATGSRAGDGIAASAERRPPAAQAAALGRGRLDLPWGLLDCHLLETACVRQRHSREPVGPLRAGWTAPPRRPHACGSVILTSRLDRSGQVGPPDTHSCECRIRISSWPVGPPGQLGLPVTRMCDLSSWAGWTSQGRLDLPPRSGTSPSHHGQVGPPRAGWTSLRLAAHHHIMGRLDLPGQVGPPAA
jgi:hypothetical protein